MCLLVCVKCAVREHIFSCVMLHGGKCGYFCKYIFYVSSLLYDVIVKDNF